MPRPRTQQAPLLRPGARRPLIAVVLGSALAVAVLGFGVAGQDTPGWFDRGLDAMAHRTLDVPVWGYVDAYFLQLGDRTNAIVLVAAITAAAALLRGPVGAALAVLGPTVAVALTELAIAPLVGRRHDLDLSFPSGHVTIVSSAAVVTVIVLLGDARPTAARRLGSAVAVVVAAAASLAVVAEKTHYSTDAVAGWCVAVSTVLAAALVLDGMVARGRDGMPAGRLRKRQDRPRHPGSAATAPEPANPDPT